MRVSNALYGLSTCLLGSILRSATVGGFFRKMGGYLPGRLDTLLAVLYLIFNEGYGFTSSVADLLRQTDQLEEAISSYEQAIALYDNPAERSHLQQKLRSLINECSL